MYSLRCNHSCHANSNLTCYQSLFPLPLLICLLVGSLSIPARSVSMRCNATCHTNWWWIEYCSVFTHSAAYFLCAKWIDAISNMPSVASRATHCAAQFTQKNTLASHPTHMHIHIESVQIFAIKWLDSIYFHSKSERHFSWHLLSSSDRRFVIGYTTHIFKNTLRIKIKQIPHERLCSMLST